MKYSRESIAPDVYLTCLRTDKFKSGCLSVSFVTQLTRETAAQNALLPRVLRRGSAKYPDMEILAALLDDYYGARLEPTVRKKGELHIIGMYADFVDDSFIPGETKLLESVSSLMTELLLHPNLRAGQLLPEYVDSEREKQLEQIRGRINEKRSYATERLIELMCGGEDYAVHRLGGESEAEAIDSEELTRSYRNLLETSPVEIFYCGMAEPERVKAALATFTRELPRGTVNEELGTAIRMNTLEETPRYFTEEMDVTQGKLSIGFRLGDSMDEFDFAAIRVMNALYGGSVTSKLFMNVRERLSLAYYASSSIDLHKGVMLVSSGIEFDKYDDALSEIMAQLDAVRGGTVTEEEIEAARKYVASSARTVVDSPGALEEYYLGQHIQGLSFLPEELAEMAEAVTIEDVVDIANCIECDAVYFLRGQSAVADGEVV